MQGVANDTSLAVVSYAVFIFFYFIWLALLDFVGFSLSFEVFYGRCSWSNFPALYSLLFGICLIL